MQFLRKIFFYIFAAIYIVFCPIMILYALGYMYKPGMEKGVMKTGLISLATVPAGATVYMNGSKFAQTTPTIIQELVPGEYSITLVMDKYRSWGRTVPVKEEKATVLDKVLLLPEDLKPAKVLEGSYQEIIPVPGSGFFLVAGGETAGAIQVYDYRQQESWPLLEEGSPFAGSKLLSWFSVEESPDLLLRVKAKEGERFLWVQVSGPKDTVKDVTDLFAASPVRVKWLPGKDPDLFVFQDGNVNRLDLSAGAVYPEYIKDVKGYGLYNNDIYVLKKDNVFLRTDYDRKSEKTLLDDPQIGATIFGDKGFFSVEVLSEDFILFLGEKGELLANRLPYRFVPQGVRGIKYYPKLNRVLLWEKDRIGVIDFSVEETGNVEFEKGPSLLWVYSGGKNIDQCFWVYEGAHILARDGEDTFLIAIEEYGEVQKAPVLKVNDASPVYYSEETGMLYFLSSSEAGLFSAVLVPHKGIVPALPVKEQAEEEGRMAGSNKSGEQAK